MELGSRGIVVLYYLCRGNKGADQMCSYQAADLGACKKQVFSLLAQMFLSFSPLKNSLSLALNFSWGKSALGVIPMSSIIS